MKTIKMSKFNTLTVFFFLCIYISFAQHVILIIPEGQEINYNSIIPFQVQVEKNGEVFSTASKNKKNKIKWRHLNLEIDGGVIYKKGLIKIHSAQQLKEKGIVNVKVGYKKMELEVDKQIELNFQGIQVVDFSGKSAKDKKNGLRLNIFEQLVNEVLFSNSGNYERAPKKGKKGKSGQYSGFTTVDLERITINNIEIVKATCLNKSLKRAEVVYAKVKEGQIKIVADGGNGGNGSQGELLTRNKPFNIAEGSKGGNGGHGRNGGTVEIYVNEDTRVLAKQIIVSAEGGRAGKAGRSFDINDGGLNGLEGNLGRVTIIDKKKK